MDNRAKIEKLQNWKQIEPCIIHRSTLRDSAKTCIKGTTHSIGIN